MQGNIHNRDKTEKRGVISTGPQSTVV